MGCIELRQVGPWRTGVRRKPTLVSKAICSRTQALMMPKVLAEGQTAEPSGASRELSPGIQGDPWPCPETPSSPLAQY